MATCAVRGGLARDERSDNSCLRKLRVPTPHESEESYLCFFLSFSIFLVGVVTSVAGTFHIFSGSNILQRGVDDIFLTS